MMDPIETQQLRDKVTHLEREAKIYRAHVENLIERVYELEQTVEVVVSRLAVVERATPLRRADKPPASKLPPRLPPSKRPTR